jgi:hypothetical protein
MTRSHRQAVDDGTAMLRIFLSGASLYRLDGRVPSLV